MIEMEKHKEICRFCGRPDGYNHVCENTDVMAQEEWGDAYYSGDDFNADIREAD